LLAYVFWHVPRAAVAAQAYESAHREFHDALRAAAVPGLLGVEVFRLASIPWLGGRAGYEDWHLLEGSAALDPLDRAAIGEARKLPHDRIASMAGDGTAGLYGLRMGARIVPAVAYWLSKPAGMGYAAFESSLAPLVADGCCLWGRRMTLGPTPEFCLHAPASREPPHPARAIELQAVPRESHAGINSP
jgi:hypothetical protein